MSTKPAMVSVRNLTRRFDVSKPWLNRVVERLPRSILTAVSDVSFEIPAQETYALVGESGSGKSTIGKMMVGLLTPTDGSVTIGGVDLSREISAKAMDAAREQIQMVFQDPYASLNPRWRVRNIITEPVAARGGDTTGLAERLLEQVGLSAEDADKYPHEFSGGQRQRLCIARALSSNPRFIVCDEPTSALDVSAGAGSEPDVRPQDRSWTDVPVHQPRSDSCAPHGGSDRRALSGSAGRRGGAGCAFHDSTPSLHQDASGSCTKA